MATGFSASDEVGGVAVSGTGNVVATMPAGSSVRGVTGHSSGKYYYEVTITGTFDADAPIVGVASSAYNLFNNPGQGNPSDSIGIFAGDTQQEIFVNNAFQNSGYADSALVSGEVIGVASDFDNGVHYFLTPELVTKFGASGWNGLTTANPAGNVGGIAVSLTTAGYIVIRSDAAITVNLNSGNAAFHYAKPTGFNPWDVWSNVASGQGFFSGRGGFTARAAVSSPQVTSFAGAGRFTAAATVLAQARATLPGTGGFFYNYASAILVSGATSQDTASASLVAQTAALAGSGTSGGSALAFLTLPTIAAATQQLQNALVDAVMRGQPFQTPLTWYIALVTQLGDTVAPGLEVSGTGYLRQPVNASLLNFSGTQGAGSTTASSGTSGSSSNNVAISFGNAGTPWGTIIGYEFWDAATGGNRWLAGKLANALTINVGDPARGFAIGALSVSIG